MKKFKVEYKKSKDTYTYYCDSPEELLEVLKEKEYDAISVKVVFVTLHHRATGRGYVTKKCVHKEFYNGRFGTGYKKIIPNATEGPASNSFHFVDYFIETNNTN